MGGRAFTMDPAEDIHEEAKLISRLFEYQGGA
jgi:hypothetical protein